MINILLGFFLGIVTTCIAGVLLVEYDERKEKKKKEVEK